jgi:hypothetical protein
MGHPRAIATDLRPNVQRHENGLDPEISFKLE